ncbi:MAG: glycosyltransferase [Polyangiales bacterium]
MRVLHCIATMGGGGAERQLCYLASGLVARGHDVTVALQRGGPNLARLEASGARVTWVGDTRASDPRLFVRVARAMRAWGAAIVQTWLPRMDLVAGAAALAQGLPWVLTERNTPAESGGRARDVLGRLAAAVVANSRSGAAEWERRGGGASCRSRTPHPSRRSTPRRSRTCLRSGCPPTRR